MRSFHVEYDSCRKDYYPPLPMWVKPHKKRQYQMVAEEASTYHSFQAGTLPVALHLRQGILFVPLQPEQGPKRPTPLHCEHLILP